MRNGSEQPVKSCIKKLKRKKIQKKIRVKFVVTYNATKLSFFTNTKDRITKLASSFVVYHFCCPGFHHDYIEKKKKSK